MLRKCKKSEEFFFLGCFSITSTVFVLNVMMDLLTPNYFTISINLAFSLSFSKIFPCWYANQTMFLFLLLMIPRILELLLGYLQFFNFAGFFFQLFFLMSLTIDNKIFKFLFYFFLRFSCFTACFRDAVKVLYLKLKN